MFGGDWPVSTVGDCYAETAGVLFELVSGLSSAEQAAVLSGAAMRVYGLAHSRADAS